MQSRVNIDNLSLSDLKIWCDKLGLPTRGTIAALLA